MGRARRGERAVRPEAARATARKLPFDEGMLPWAMLPMLGLFACSPFEPGTAGSGRLSPDTGVAHTGGAPSAVPVEPLGSVLPTALLPACRAPLPARDLDWGDPATCVRGVPQPVEDCAPNDDTVGPDRVEVRGDGLDQDCDGSDGIGRFWPVLDVVGEMTGPRLAANSRALVLARGGREVCNEFWGLWDWQIAASSFDLLAPGSPPLDFWWVGVQDADGGALGDSFELAVSDEHTMFAYSSTWGSDTYFETVCDTEPWSLGNYHVFEGLDVPLPHLSLVRDGDLFVISGSTGTGEAQLMSGTEDDLCQAGLLGSGVTGVPSTPLAAVSWADEVRFAGTLGRDATDVGWSAYDWRVVFDAPLAARRDPASGLHAIEAHGRRVWTRAQRDGLWVEIDGVDVRVAGGPFEEARAAVGADGGVAIVARTAEGGACLYEASDGAWTGPTDLSTGLGCADGVDIVRTADGLTGLAARCANHLAYAAFR